MPVEEPTGGEYLDLLERHAQINRATEQIGRTLVIIAEAASVAADAIVELERALHGEEPEE